MVRLSIFSFAFEFEFSSRATNEQRDCLKCIIREVEKTTCKCGHPDFTLTD